MTQPGASPVPPIRSLLIRWFLRGRHFWSTLTDCCQGGQKGGRAVPKKVVDVTDAMNSTGAFTLEDIRFPEPWRVRNRGVVGAWWSGTNPGVEMLPDAWNGLVSGLQHQCTTSDQLGKGEVSSAARGNFVFLFYTTSKVDPLFHLTETVTGRYIKPLDPVAAERGYEFGDTVQLFLLIDGTFEMGGASSSKIPAPRKFLRMAPGEGETFVPRAAELGETSSIADLLRNGHVPGSQGVTLTDEFVEMTDLWRLATRNGRNIEFHLTREGGKLRLYSGTNSSVVFPEVGKSIVHVHPPAVGAPATESGRFLNSAADRARLLEQEMRMGREGMTSRVLLGVDSDGTPLIQIFDSKGGRGLWIPGPDGGMHWLP